jgi:hypothetical protein
MSSVRPSGDRPWRYTEPDNVLYWKAPLFGAIQTRIGQELQARYQPPTELPQRLLALLILFDHTAGRE